MSEEAYAAMLTAMGQTPLELRICVLLVLAAKADGELSEDEGNAIAEHMKVGMVMMVVRMTMILTLLALPPP
jgi:uncharacterized membrane protein YebE (DUF533 family)